MSIYRIKRLTKLFKVSNNYYKKVGEAKVDFILNKLSLKITLKHLNKIIYIDDKNESQQIDHVVISVKGIFVIKTITINGLILGNQNESKWIQIVSNSKYQFPNPLIQNNANKNYISNILCDKYDVQLITVFTENNANIKCSNVINLIDLKKHIINSNTKLEESEINEIYNTLTNKIESYKC